MSMPVYISDTKLDDLAAEAASEQPNFLATLSASLTIDLKIVQATIAQKTSDETRPSKLHIVREYVKKHKHVGSVEHPRAYFSGTLPMRWGTLDSGMSAPGSGSSPETLKDIVYFSGDTPYGPLGLIGSYKHVRGASAEPTAVSASVDPHVLWWHYIADRQFSSGVPTTENEQLELYCSIIKHINESFRNRPPQRLEFLATRLLQWPLPENDRPDATSDGFLLGSPIYVARPDD